MRPLEQADLRRVRAVFTDVDGTLTTGGQLHSSTLGAIETLVASGVDVVLVSGRPSGWGECWARQLPVAGVIVENGGLYFARERNGSISKTYAVSSAATRAKHRRQLEREVFAALKVVRGARLSMDSAATEVDLAIDYAEEGRLGPDGADRLEMFLRKRGITAVRSSVHVNCWVGTFDKRSMVEKFIRNEWQRTLRAKEARYVYVGDSYNDEPMFRAFSLSIGVANVLDVVDRLGHLPKFVTTAREGSGFREVADAIIRSQQEHG